MNVMNINTEISEADLAIIVKSYINYLKTYEDDAIAKSGVDFDVLTKELMDSVDLRNNIMRAFKVFKDTFMEDPEAYMDLFDEPKEYALAHAKLDKAESDILDAEEEQTDQQKIDAAILLLRKNGYITKAKDEK